MYVTLLNSDIERHRVKNGCSNDVMERDGFGTDNQRALLDTTLQKLCDQHGYTLTRIRDDEYFDTQKMLFLGYHLQKKE